MFIANSYFYFENNLSRYLFAPGNFYLRLQLILLSIIYVFQQRVFRLKTLRLS